jgi:hypothetical protein
MSWSGGNYARCDARRRQGSVNNNAVLAEEENGWMNGVDERKDDQTELTTCWSTAILDEDNQKASDGRLSEGGPIVWKP